MIYGAYILLLGVALLAEGVGVARGGAWQGWKRWLPLSLGVWLLLVAFPALALSFDAARSIGHPAGRGCQVIVGAMG